MIELDRIYNMDCMEWMKQIPDGRHGGTLCRNRYDNPELIKVKKV
jgi:DNA modification methylase